MFEELDRRTSLTGNQKRIVAAAVLGDMLEFFDYFLIGFVLAFIVGPWGLTFGQSAIILLSSGFGAIGGAYFWGWMADRIGRRPVFNLTILNFSLATGILAFTPDNGWIFLTIFRFVVGFGVGGLYCVDLPLVQEFMPSKKRGLIGGLVTVFIPVGVLPGLLAFLARIWVPESSRWLAQQGRLEEAHKSLAWALEVTPESLPLPRPEDHAEPNTRWTDQFRYPRSLIVSWFGDLGAQTGVYGVTL
jgi:MFS transporter, putative metabolite:H+ symporter